MKKRSLKKRIFLFWIIWVVLIACLVIFYSCMYFGEYGKAYLKDFQTLSGRYVSDLRHDLNMMQEQIENYYASSMDYMQMIVREQDEVKKIKTLAHIKNSIKTQAGILPCVGGYFFYDRADNVMRSACARYEKSMPLLNRTLKQTLYEEETRDTYRDFFVHDGETFLLCSIGMKGKSVGFFLDLNAYYSLDEEMEAVFLMEDGTVIARSGADLISDEYAAQAAENAWQGILLEDVAVTSDVITEFPGLKLVFARNFDRGIWFWQRREFWLMMVLVPLMAVVFSVIFYRILQQTLLSPVLHIVSRIQEMKQSGDSKAVAKTEIVEYSRINHQIDEMLDQIKNLQEEKMQEQLRANDAQLQYYQLQTDPHFYLNCLNTVSILLQQNSAEMANDLIVALSSHFRYMFRGNRTLVTVEEEIAEVQDYCSIYNIRSGFPILLQMEVQEATKKMEVPLLCIQTFVENSIKHGGKTNQVLTIRVQVNLMKQDDQKQALHIRISDNGQGYPDEILEELNCAVTDFRYKSMHVGTDNLKYRLTLLYGGKANIYFYNLPYGGAATELTLPEGGTE